MDKKLIVRVLDDADKQLTIEYVEKIIDILEPLPLALKVLVIDCLQKILPKHYVNRNDTHEFK